MSPLASHLVDKPCDSAACKEEHDDPKGVQGIEVKGMPNDDVDETHRQRNEAIPEASLGCHPQFFSLKERLKTRLLGKFEEGLAGFRCHRERHGGVVHHMAPIYFVHTHPAMPLDTCGIKASLLSFHDDRRTFAIPKLVESIEPANGPADVVSVEEANNRLGKLDWIKDAKMALCRWDYTTHGNMLNMTVWILPEPLPDHTDLDEPEWYKPSSVLDKMTDTIATTYVKRDDADKAAAGWIEAHIAAKGLDKDTLTKADWFLLSREVPCEIRCWRIGEPVYIAPGEVCPECGKLRPAPSVWDRLLNERD